MTCRLLAAFVSIVCLGSPLPLPAQTSGKHPAPAAPSYVPTYTFQPDSNSETKYPVPSPIYTWPPQCAEDGTVFVDFYVDTPSRSSPEILFALGSHGKETAYPLEEIHDLYDLAHRIPTSVDVTDTGISFLLYATRDSNVDYPEGKRPRYTGDHGWYIARFDLKGSYQDSVPIDIPHFEPAGIAQFDTGQYLVLGFDTLELVPKLAMLDSDGQLQRFLNPPKPLPIKSPFQESKMNPSTSKRRRRTFQVRLAARIYQLTHHGDAIDLLEPGSQGPIFEVFPDSSMNVIPIHPQPGYELGLPIPSNEKTLFVRFRPTGKKEVKQGQGSLRRSALQIELH